MESLLFNKNESYPIKTRIIPICGIWYEFLFIQLKMDERTTHFYQLYREYSDKKPEQLHYDLMRIFPLDSYHP